MILLTNLLVEIKYDLFTNQIVNKLFSRIKSSQKRNITFTISYDEPLIFDLDVEIRRISNIEKSNLYYKDTEAGFAIDSEAFPIDDQIYLRVDLDPKKEPKIYNILSGFLKEYVRHELDHLDQVQSKWIKQSKSGKGFKYFITKNEVPAMVAGMKKRAKHEKRPIELIFNQCLDYAMKKGNIKNEKERDIVFAIWKKQAKL